MVNISNLQDNYFGMSVVSMPNFMTFPRYNFIFIPSYKANPKTKNHKKNNIRCALLAPLHLESHFVHTIPCNDFLYFSNDLLKSS